VKHTATLKELPAQQQQLQVQHDELDQAKDILKQKLQKDILEKTVQIEKTEKGLQLTFAADSLFDPGKSKLRFEAYALLDAVSRVLVDTLSASRISIEGHTDNEAVGPLGWKSNWELSAARAMSIIHYFQDDKGIEGSRLSAVAFGEYRPVADNSTREGRQSNRRIEIVIMPPEQKAQEITLPEAKTS